MYVDDPSIVNVQPLYDVETNIKSDEIYAKIKLLDSHEELEADLGGFCGDFHRHRVDKAIKKRIALTEQELVTMITENNRMKEINLAIRSIDPERNGFLTQQEMDDIFRENYRKEMEDKHIFELIKDFRSISNKILVDYGKFRTWVYAKLIETQRNQK